MIFKKKLTDLHEESGQTLLEFALVLMFVILPFTFVLIDGAMTLYTQASLTNAAREGARAGSIYQCGAVVVPPITCSLSYTEDFDIQWATVDTARRMFVEREIENMVGPLVPFSSCITSISYSPREPDVGDPNRQFDSINVSLSCPRSLFFGLAGAYQIMLGAQSTMQIEPGGVAPESP